MQQLPREKKKTKIFFLKNESWCVQKIQKRSELLKKKQIKKNDANSLSKALKLGAHDHINDSMETMLEALTDTIHVPNSNHVFISLEK